MHTIKPATQNSGYRLWIGYEALPEARLRLACSRLLSAVEEWLPTDAVCTQARAELILALRSMRGEEALALTSPALTFSVQTDACDLKEGAFVWHSDSEQGLRLDAGDSAGVLYGVFALIRHLRLGQSLETLNFGESPFFERRMLNHWDNLDATFSKTGELVERGYAGASLFDLIQGTTDLARIRDYARALASIGLNHIVLNNVNADPRILESTVLAHIVPVADIFRAWGVRVWVSVNFASPMRTGGLSTADPLAPEVRSWWAEKCREIYTLIPDFGGFLVKASSEGEPGPHDFGRDHPDGANMLAEALRPHGGTCIWRAFVYGKIEGRSGHAYDHFKPLDGQFADNVILQIKHGPVDFLPNEPTSPLFGQMPKTHQGLELMITQEYTGQQIHLYYYGPLWERILQFDTGATDSASPTIAGVTRKSIAGVPNVGDTANWCAHPLAQANWYAYGRMAWNPHLGARTVAEEWASLTFGPDPEVVRVVSEILLASPDAYVDYIGPFGLCMLHGGDHFSPAPENRRYVHQASPEGIGRDRTRTTGSGDTGHYLPPHREAYENPATCPPEYLLYFHRVPLTHEIEGSPIIEAIRQRVWRGADQVEVFIRDWEKLREKIPDDCFAATLGRLGRQLEEARRWAQTLDGFFTESTMG